MARWRPDWGSLSNLRIDTGPSATVEAPESRPRPMAGKSRMTIIALTSVTPTTRTNVTIATVSGFMGASHLDLGDAPHHEEADGLHGEARAQKHGREGRLQHGREVAGAHQLEHDGEGHRAQPHADGRPAVLGRQGAGVAQDFEALPDDLAQPVQDLGEIPAGAALDEDRGA